MKLLKYIQGLRKGKEAHRIEKEAMRDPFLSEALEGFDSVQDDHAKSIEALRSQIETRSRKPQRNRLIWGWSIAASIFICAFLGGYYFLQPERMPVRELAQEIDSLHQPSPPMIPAPPEDIVSQVREVETPAPATPERKQEKRERAATRPSGPSHVTTETDRSVKTPRQQEALPQWADEVAAEEMQRTEVPLGTSIPSYSLSSANRRTTKGKGISGVVVSAQDGEPLIGASIVVEGTDQGTMTDMDGFFEISTNEGERITVSYIGHNSLTLPADSSKLLTIAMQEDTQALDEVIVVGYGTMKKSSMTGSSSQVKESWWKRQRTYTPKPVIGKRAYRNYLKENIAYPTAGKCAQAEGKVQVSFFVRNGRPYNIHIRKSLCEELDREVERLIQEGPDWTKGTKEVKMTIRLRKPPAGSERTETP